MGRPDCYRRDGTPMYDVLEWARYRGSIDCRVARSVLPDGKIVSTVYIGLDMGHGGVFGGPPLIFETMVFSEHEHPVVLGRIALARDVLDCDRYPTEDEARAGHERMAAKWTPVAPEG